VLALHEISHSGENCSTSSEHIVSSGQLSGSLQHSACFREVWAANIFASSCASFGYHFPAFVLQLNHSLGHSFGNCSADPSLIFQTPWFGLLAPSFCLFSAYFVLRALLFSGASLGTIPSALWLFPAPCLSFLPLFLHRSLPSAAFRLLSSFFSDRRFCSPQGCASPSHLCA
jgi:hypothetical protein